MTQRQFSQPRHLATRQTPNQDRDASFTINGLPIAVAPLSAGLYLVATPIGNLEDISLRALRILAGADKVYCEDTRVSRKLIDRYAISQRLATYHEHNAARRLPEIVGLIEKGGAVALVSDAGTPLISDPGFKLVRALAGAQLPVTAIPGACAAIAGATVSGIATDELYFVGFLPNKAQARERAITALSQIRATLVFYEGPSRLGATLAAMARLLGDRDAAVTRELTKLHEEVAHGSLGELARRYAGASPRGEITLVVAGAGPRAEPEPDAIDDLLRAALGTLSVRDAAATVAAQTGIAKRAAYKRALALANGLPDK